MAKTDFLKRLRQFLPLLVFLAGMLPVLLHLGTAGLFETSEARYASVARQMIDSGDWLTPRQNGLKHLTKPPVTYWLSALGMKLFGINEFGARFFLSVAAGLTALGTFLIGRLFFGTLSGLIATLVLITTLFFQIQFRGLTTDPFLAAGETLMVFCFFSWLNSQRQRWLYSFWLMAALAFMIKGPPALLPLAGLIPAAIMTGQKQSIRQLFLHKAGWAIFLVAGLGWYLTMAMMNSGLLSYFLIDETLKRVASSSHRRVAPFYYFLVLLPAGIFPWVSFFFVSLKERIKEFRDDPAAVYLLLWLVAPLVVFSLSRSKLAGYALPLLVPMALMVGEAVRKAFFSQNNENYDQAAWHCTGIAAITSLIGMGLSVWGYQNFSGFRVIAQTAIFAGMFWLFASLVMLAFIIKRSRHGMLAMLAIIVPGMMFFVLHGIRGNEPYRENRWLTSQWMLLKRIATLPESQKLILVDEMIEGWYFYAGRPVRTFNIPRITQFDNQLAGELVLGDLEAFKKAIDSDTLLVIPDKSIKHYEGLTAMDFEIITGEGKWKIVAPSRKQGG
ncbi:MAG: glycosyltransferase family 39 protein [Candidatus Riflebacteria bacterium]|nr:glycosyltransferase family 39 protein [Candidatus Riflebacteria bacterium]